MELSIKHIDLQRKSELYYESKNVFGQFIYITPSFEIPIRAWFSVAGGRSGAKRVYCDVIVRCHDDFVNSENTYGAGSAFANGYGYDRSSAAMEYALAHAGVTFTNSFAGRGQSVSLGAIELLASAIGFSGGKALML